MSFLSPTLRLENLSTQPTMTQDHVPEDQRYNKQNIVAQWCVPINGKVPAIIFQNRHLHLMEIRDNYPPIPIFIFCDFCFCADVPHRAGTWHNQWAAHDLGQWTGKFFSSQRAEWVVGGFGARKVFAL